MECSKHATLNVIKAYLEKHENKVHVIELITYSQTLRDEVSEILKF